MALKIVLGSTLRKYLPDYDPAVGLDVEAAGGITVAALCERIHVPQDRVTIIMVNGKSEALDYVLNGDERVSLFPPVGGG